MIYEVFVGATACVEVARKELSSEDSIPDFKNEDIVFPCDMGVGAGVCAIPETAEIWFVDENGNEVNRFSLNPATANGIHVVDAGNVFDESDEDKTFFYFEMAREDEEWSYGTIETDGEIVPENVTVIIKRYINSCGQTIELFDPSSVVINGEELCGDSIGGEGSNGNSFWILHNGKRKSVVVEMEE